MENDSPKNLIDIEYDKIVSNCKYLNHLSNALHTIGQESLAEKIRNTSDEILRANKSLSLINQEEFSKILKEVQ